MNTVTKMVLVPLERYRRLQEMDRPLSKETRSESGQKEIGSEREINLESGHKEISSELGQVEHLDTEVILSSIPKHYKYKIKAILAHIQHDPRNILGWDDKGQLLYHGKVISGSHISDLLKSTQRAFKSFVPLGEKEFYQGLKDIHVPTSLWSGMKSGQDPYLKPPKELKSPKESKPGKIRPPGVLLKPSRKQASKWVSI